MGNKLTFAAFREANVARCLKWHPDGIESWSPSDWLTAVAGELGELASLLKMRNRERDGLVGNKFSPTDQQIADEIADVFTYLDLLAHVLGVDMAKAITEKFNRVSERNGFPDRLDAGAAEIERLKRGLEFTVSQDEARRANIPVLYLHWERTDEQVPARPYASPDPDPNGNFEFGDRY